MSKDITHADVGKNDDIDGAYDDYYDVSISYSLLHKLNEG
jgi:hypothetical protein